MSQEPLFLELAPPLKEAAPGLSTRRRDPFRIEGLTQVSFSGGRTSAYMLRRCLDAAPPGGLDPAQVHVLFANTGKEREETLAFVRDVEAHWGIPVHWLEWRAGTGAGLEYAEVSFEIAARQGEPFDALTTFKQAIPNRNQRFCTQVLKVETMRAFMRAQGCDQWDVLIGIRADEPRRAAHIRNRRQMENEDIRLPLWDAGVTKGEVLAFWRQQPFDLQLPASESNCDLCFLKGAGERLRIMRRDPWRAAWWLEQEEKTGATWINPQQRRPRYADLYQMAISQKSFAFGDDDELLDCLCGESE